MFPNSVGAIFSSSDELSLVRFCTDHQLGVRTISSAFGPSARRSDHQLGVQTISSAFRPSARRSEKSARRSTMSVPGRSTANAVESTDFTHTYYRVTSTWRFRKQQQHRNVHV